MNKVWRVSGKKFVVDVVADICEISVNGDLIFLDAQGTDFHRKVIHAFAVGHWFEVRAV